MPLKFRQILFISFAIIFVIATIYISLYATGYRFNLTWPLKFNQLLIKTGSLIVESKPGGAQVSLIGQSKWLIASPKISNSDGYKTPAKIHNLLPGDYQLKIELANYWPLMKDIVIAPGETNYLNNIELFKQDQPIKISDAKIQNLTLVATRNQLILNDQKKIINLKTEQISDLKTAIPETPSPRPDVTLTKPKNINIISWIDNDNFLFANDFEIYLYNIPGNYQKIIARLSQKIIAVLYEPSNYVIYASNTEISLLNLEDNKVTSLLKADRIGPPVVDSRGEILYFTAQINSQTGLYKLRIK